MSELESQGHGINLCENIFKKRNLSRLLILLSDGFILYAYCKKEYKNTRYQFACLRFSMVKEGS